MRYFSLLSFIVAAPFFLTACASADHTATPPQLVASPDKVSMMLAQAADRASVALETLAAVEQSRTPDMAVGPIEDAPVALRRTITVNWVGPVEPITQKLAERASYSFQTIGMAPPVPVVVSIDAENEPVVDILRSIGLQMGLRADINVDAVNEVVEIHYAPTTGIGG